MLTLLEARSVHSSMNRPKIEFITYIYINFINLSVKYMRQFSPNLAGFPDVLGWR